jgi:methyl coenzyme M reductase subunit C-like uncharacterized protein (methanogenesis marker protein 7)
MSRLTASGAMRVDVMSYLSTAAATANVYGNTRSFHVSQNERFVLDHTTPQKFVGIIVLQEHAPFQRSTRSTHWSHCTTTIVVQFHRLRCGVGLFGWMCTLDVDSLRYGVFVVGNESAYSRRFRRSENVKSLQDVFLEKNVVVRRSRHRKLECKPP